MRVQTLLCVGALGGATFIAAPVLSQNSPTTPRPQTPPGGPDATPRQPAPRSSPTAGKATGQMQSLNSLVGTWDVTVKTFATDGTGSSQSTPTSQSQGTSTRTWILDNKILQEEVRCGDVRTISRANTDEFEALQNEPPRPGSPPGKPDMPSGRPGAPPDRPDMPDRDMMHQAFQGHGMFGFDSRAGQFEHVWADSHDSKLTMSVGKYDESSKTFTFMVNRMPGARVSPSPPPSTPGVGNPDDKDQVTPGNQPPGNQPRPNQPPGQPGQPPQTPPRTPGATPPSSAPPNMADLDRVVIRIQGEDRHVVEYYKSGASGQSAKFMEVSYVKSR